MVGFVIVSHSETLANGVVELTKMMADGGTFCAVVVDSEVCESDNHWKPRPSTSPPNQMASTANKSTGVSHHGSFC